MITPFERFLDFVDKDRKLTLRAATFLEELAGLSNPEAWREVGASGQPDFENSWTNYNSATHNTAAFYKDGFGIVRIKGTVSGGTSSDPIFTLPEGYRPSARVILATVQSGGTFAYIGIDANGEVEVIGGSVGTLASIDGVSFRV